MKIEIKGQTKEFYKEFLSIVGSYNKIKKNPSAKIKDKFNEYNSYMIISIIFEVFSVFSFSLNKSNINLILLVLFAVCIVLSVFIVVFMRTNLNNQINNHLDSTAIIDEEGISLKNSKSNIKIMWTNVECVILNKETIVFISMDNSALICIPSKYSKEIFKGIKKFVEEDKIIKNI